MGLLQVIHSVVFVQNGTTPSHIHSVVLYKMGLFQVIYIQLFSYKMGLLQVIKLQYIYVQNEFTPSLID
jgi:hypothetical protein